MLRRGIHCVPSRKDQPVTIRLRRLLRRSRLVQVALVFAFWFIGTAIVRLVGLPVPGGVVGMLLVLGLLASRRLSTASLRRGTDWLLGDMLLFFVPVCLAVLDHPELLGVLGLKIMIVILAGTTAVMGATALTVDLCWRWRAARVPVDRIGQ
jgi:holin-like protein